MYKYILYAKFSKYVPGPPLIFGPSYATDASCAKIPIKKTLCVCEYLNYV